MALEEAQARAASLAEQTRQAEADANDAKQQLGEAANRAAAAAERAGELGEEVKRQRMRAEEAETQVLAVSVERDRALSKAKQLEAELQAKGVALMMREGASSAKVAELSEREVRLSGALEEERARAGALARQLASSKEREENARIEGARLGARMAEVEARGKAVEVELEETKAAVVRADAFVQGRMAQWLDYFEKVIEHNGADYMLGEICYADLSLFQLVSGLEYAFPNAFEEHAANIPRVVASRDAIAERPGVAEYLASERRIPFNEDGIFRHYPELDLK